MTIEQGEIYSIRWWFDIDYARKEQKYRRLIALGDSSAEELLMELYKEAEEKRARIHELEAIVASQPEEEYAFNPEQFEEST